MNNTNILLRHNFVSIPFGNIPCDDNLSDEVIGTILMNVSYYGYALSVSVYKALLDLSHNDLVAWWQEVEIELKEITGDSRKMADFVVYKNFPTEVLEKTAAEYWIPQILMYWGFPTSLFTQPVEPRPEMKEKGKATVLRRTSEESLSEIYKTLLSSPARWKDYEFKDVLSLATQLSTNISMIMFKENLIALSSEMMKAGTPIRITTATDVLRLAVGLSDGDISLRENGKFISFKRPVRKYLLDMLEGCNHLADDVAARTELWKRLFHQLHAGDWQKRYPNVIQIADDLYMDRLVTFNSKVESALTNKSVEALSLLASRPGDFRRRLVHLIELFGSKAVETFLDPKVLGRLTTAQVVATKRFFETMHMRHYRVFPPKGNWTKLKVSDARWVEEEHANRIVSVLGTVLNQRVPKIGFLADETNMVKLPNNGESGPFTRGTAFPIPDDVNFIRSASYWKVNRHRNVWFDNGWNFFDESWKYQGACCWNTVSFPLDWKNYRFSKKLEDAGAIFSGDPVNSQEMNGRACQMIDLHIDKLLDQGVRYAVWNILAYSHITFSDAEDVFAALQWGADATAGKLFEPSRAQIAFQVTGKQMTKYICMIDLKERKLIYLDANLRGNVQSAASNGKLLEEQMPAVMDYLHSLPSVYDLFCHSVDLSSPVKVLYSDKDTELKNIPAWVFKPENKNNSYQQININGLLR